MRKTLILLLLVSLLSMTAPTFALTITNAGFETDTAVVTGATGWTITSGGTDWFTTTAGMPDSVVDPAAASEGINWLSGNRLAGGAGAVGTGTVWATVVVGFWPRPAGDPMHPQ